MIRVFISSVQKELAPERRAVKDFILHDPLLSRFIGDVFLFEDLPASDRRTDQVYLDQVDRCSIYIGIYGVEYGMEDADGLSPTEREFDQASTKSKTRLIFVKGADDKARHPKILKLIKKAGGQLIRRRFNDTPDLTVALYASLVEFLESTGYLRIKPFDAAACPDATVADLSREKLTDFLSVAKADRRYALGPSTSMSKALNHLNLLDGDKPSHAAVLLFGKQPQRFLLTSEVKCMHFHGAEVEKPIPSYHIYKGTVFELVDQAVDFVMAKIDRAVIPQDNAVASQVKYELPYKAVREAIVNAVTHRDYTSNASVQVMLFADRLEVWNPGELPPPLTIAGLRVPHASIPHNPLIAEPMFLATYAEKAGSGILDMIKLCREAGVRAPAFRQDGGQFVQTLWRPKAVVAAQSDQPSRPTRQAIRSIVSQSKAHDEAHDEAHEPISWVEHRIMEACQDSSRSTPELLSVLGYAVRTGNFKRGLKRLIAMDLLEMSMPGKPRSRNQNYRLSAKGRIWLAKEKS
jgi:ATP-dependent DNA helicase RecG